MNPNEILDLIVKIFAEQENIVVDYTIEHKNYTEQNSNV